MHPLFVKIGGFPIHWFGVMMALAFFAGLANWTWLGRKEGRDFNYCSDLVFWIMVSGVIGARLAYVVSDFKMFAAAPVRILYLQEGGLIYYGGFVGALIALGVFARVHKEKGLALLDFAVTSLPLGHALGRIGCFLNGCCHGREYEGLFSVTYPWHSLPWYAQYEANRLAADAGRTNPVHPVQLYEAAFNLVLYVLLVMAFRRRKTDGGVTVLYLLLYPAGRFLFEFLRGDERMQWFHLNVAQALSAVFFTVGIVLWLVLRRLRPVVSRP